METGHTSSKHARSILLNKAMITQTEYDRIQSDFNSDRSQVLHYMWAYQTSLKLACKTHRAINRLKEDPKQVLTRHCIEELVDRGAPNRSMSYLERKFYRTLVNRGKSEPIRLTRCEVFVYGRLFEHQEKLKVDFASPFGRKSITDALQMQDVACVAYSFLEDDLVKQDIKRREDGSRLFIDTNMIMQNTVYEDMSKSHNLHWPAFVRATETHILIVG